MNIPLTTIQRIHIASPGNSIYLTCKDYRTICITLSAFERDKNFVDMVYHTLVALSFYTTGRYNPKSALFAFKNLTYLTSSEEGWNICDIIKEYVRQGLYDMKEWQVCTYDDSLMDISHISIAEECSALKDLHWITCLSWNL